MRLFYLKYPKCQTASVKLSWSHYCELLSISDENKRSFYEKEAINSNWSVRELKRQIDTSLYERLLLSKVNFNKEQVLALATNGVEMSEPVDIIKDHYYKLVNDYPGSRKCDCRDSFYISVQKRIFRKVKIQPLHFMPLKENL